MNRWLEWILSTVGIMLVSPLLVVIACLVKAHDGGTILYRARRVGCKGKLFEVYKFRTMLPGADRIGGPLTSSSDSRVTPVGRFLRRWKLDELPQLFNVWKGDMSFVGPRPEDPRYVALYSADQRSVLEVRPGITSPASLRFRDEASLLTGDDWEKRYVSEILPEKLSIEVDYLRRRTSFSDMSVIFKTLISVLR